MEDWKYVHRTVVAALPCATLVTLMLTVAVTVSAPSWCHMKAIYPRREYLDLAALTHPDVRT